MKSMKKLVALFLVISILFATAVSVNAVSIEKGIERLKTQFVVGEGPVVGNYSVDYRYFSPVKEGDTTKYPLVVWLHGMGDGETEGKQVQKSNIAYWVSDEFQARFKPAGGAFVLAARSREEHGITWTNEMIEPLRAAIDEFIANNKDNIDLSRIYVGGYSMGGKMTLKMIVAYPQMFAAAFPICPAWAPDESLTSLIADIPVWLVSGVNDPLVNYEVAVTPTWENIIKNSNVKEKCRFSSLEKVCYEDGTPTSSAHHAWFAVNHDLFSAENGDYPHMMTVNGLGEKVTLTYPDGMISWLSEQTSDYDGTVFEGKGNITDETSTDNVVSVPTFIDIIKRFLQAIVDMIIGWK